MMRITSGIFERRTVLGESVGSWTRQPSVVASVNWDAPMVEEGITFNDPEYDALVVNFSERKDRVSTGKSWMQTHTVAVIPGAPRNSVVALLIDQGKKREREPLSIDSELSLQQNGDLPSEWADHIAIMRKEPIPGSKWSSDEKAVDDLSKFNREFHVDYGIPTSTEAIVALAWSYLNRGVWDHPVGTQIICNDNLAASRSAPNALSISPLKDSEAMIYPVMRG